MNILKKASLTTKLLATTGAVFSASIFISTYSRSYLVALICFISAMILMYVFFNMTLKDRITITLKTVDEISSGNLTHMIDVEGGDELALLGDSVNNVTRNLRNEIFKISTTIDLLLKTTDNLILNSEKFHIGIEDQNSALERTIEDIEHLNDYIKSISSSTEELSNSAGNTSSSITRMSANIEKIAKTSNVFSKSTDTTVSSIEEMAATIREIVMSLDALSLSSEEAASSLSEINSTVREVEQKAYESARQSEKATMDSSDKGMKAIDDVFTGMDNIKQSMDDIAKAINVLYTRSKEIGRILNVIGEVADQTNLLAINAAILAAKAGEHGKPFAVVADEIKNLAERTSFSTNEIASLVSSIQNETKSCVELTSVGIRNVDKGVDFVRDARDVLESIVESSATASTMAKFIQRATVEQTKAVKQITDAVRNNTLQIEHISNATKEHGKGSLMVSESCEQIRGMAASSEHAVKDQTATVRMIADSIENIVAIAGQIDASLKNQRDLSSNILFSISKIAEIHDNCSVYIKGLKENLRLFESETREISSEIKRFKI